MRSRPCFSALSDGNGEGLIEHTEDILLTREFLLTRDFIAKVHREVADIRRGAGETSPAFPLTKQIHSALAQLRSELGLLYRAG